MVPRRRPAGSIRRALSRTPRRWPISTCCACRRSRATFPIPGSPAAAAKTSSPKSRASCPISRAVPGVAVDVPGDAGRRRHFGNLILSRLSGGAGISPSAALPGRSGPARNAADRARSRRAAPFGDVRVITTHLEYYGTVKRAAQVEALRSIYAEGSGHARLGPDRRDGRRTVSRLSAARRDDHHRRLQSSSRTIRLHARMVEPFGDGTPPLADAWELAHPGAAHPATFKILRKGASRRTGAALRFHLRVRQTWRRA